MSFDVKPFDPLSQVVLLDKHLRDEDDTGPSVRTAPAKGVEAHRDWVVVGHVEQASANR